MSKSLTKKCLRLKIVIDCLPQHFLTRESKLFNILALLILLILIVNFREFFFWMTKDPIPCYYMGILILCICVSYCLFIFIMCSFDHSWQLGLPILYGQLSIDLSINRCKKREVARDVRGPDWVGFGQNLNHIRYYGLGLVK
jgi:hypothetical protein